MSVASDNIENPSTPSQNLSIDLSYQGPQRIEGFLIKVKSSHSRRLFTNYVKRYFILDLQSLTLSYKQSEKANQIRKVISLSDIVRVHKHSTIGQNQNKISKSIVLEWQFDFMLELCEKGLTKITQTANTNMNATENNQKRIMILLANQEQVYHQFLCGFQALRRRDEGVSSCFEGSQGASQSSSISPQTLATIVRYEEAQILLPTIKVLQQETDQGNTSEQLDNPNQEKHVVKFHNTHHSQQLAVSNDFNKKRFIYQSFNDNSAQNQKHMTDFSPQDKMNLEIKTIKQLIIHNKNSKSKTGVSPRKISKTSHNNGYAPPIYRDLINFVKSQADKELEQQAQEIYEQINTQQQALTLRDNLWNDNIQHDDHESSLQKMIMLDSGSECEWSVDIDEKNQIADENVSINTIKDHF